MVQCMHRLVHVCMLILKVRHRHPPINKVWGVSVCVVCLVHVHAYAGSLLCVCVCVCVLVLGC